MKYVYLKLFLWIGIIAFSFPSELAGQQGNKGPQGSKEIIAQIDRPARPRQLSYSPEDGSTVNLNPPPFVWVPLQPVSNNFIYILQVSKDKEFKSMLPIEATVSNGE